MAENRWPDPQREPRLDRVADGSRILRHLLTLRDIDLQSHQIEPRNQFRHRMLHLNAGVHFDEIKFAGGRDRNSTVPALVYPIARPIATAASPILRRRSSVSAGEGVSSMIF